MYHMKQASVRDLRYHFSDVERLLQNREEVEITKRRRVVARLIPVSAQPHRRRRPDFLARLRTIYGRKLLKVSGAELVAQERDRY
jgi:antitoxin (DNA-binding transcriptional repressor) of toxin-antitoxin stability system